MSGVGCRRLVIAGTGSGVGKTSVTLGLMAALRRRGLTVQGFKCGPDYIDPAYHRAVTGRPSRNLDTWMVTPDTMREIFLRGSEGCDISVIEGVMGLYDGKDPLANTGSTAEIAMLLEAPVLLVVNVQSMARSAAAVVLGYQKLDERVRIAGVIVNKCGSEGHYRMVKAAIEQVCGVPVIGWLKRDERLDIPERHLGLVPAIERGDLGELFEHAADLVEHGVDLDAIAALAGEAPKLQWPEERLFRGEAAALEGGSLTDAGTKVGEDASGPTIAVALDAAFNFYYPENLELLEQAGARLRYFSPLAGEKIPADADGLYIGGGFPEEFAAQLAAGEAVKADLRTRIDNGLPVFAECGGYMYLARSITDRAGVSYPMAGVIPADVRMQSKLAALGYREATALVDCPLLEKGETVRGHEFHYSTLTAELENYPYVYETKGMRGSAQEGYCRDNVMAGYTHVHFASNPRVVERFAAQCREFGGRQACLG
ncbi:cobyrinic acid a,c-diamide synthase [Paenibacillus darwinianus]|uniref:Cobyrinate a,c-diamide synthase n=1 Tax=Paenibacillus darwinianus TaxID=1380763 RepID=A0A9W5W840_9BACL|nr:cobyrinate a,c-diamide synthase [Paenibacillus darwinianus]EXX86011.1 cobyrinic acid a,c-diamide synthase [Paenibacillus darwinianus]EXX88782.1 cobyrinic acid a,c-diamide synthase [Paenibacillus darwinianus]EXX89763.1 cobyrinic acid a,c-diamide synthase [Paenibacillus darwinianus]